MTTSVTTDRNFILIYVNLNSDDGKGQHWIYLVDNMCKDLCSLCGIKIINTSTSYTFFDGGHYAWFPYNRSRSLKITSTQKLTVIVRSDPRIINFRDRAIPRDYMEIYGN